MPVERHLRLTIARKIALAVIAIVITCVGTMAWVTSVNLQRGFVDYLNHIQTQDLEKLGERLAVRYRQEGNWDWLRDNRRAMRDILDQMTLTIQGAGRPAPRADERPPRRGGDGPLRPDEGRPPRLGDGRPPRPEFDRPQRPNDDRPPPPEDDGPPGERPPRPHDPIGFAAVEQRSSH